MIFSLGKGASLASNVLNSDNVKNNSDVENHFGKEVADKDKKNNFSLFLNHEIAHESNENDAKKEEMLENLFNLLLAYINNQKNNEQNNNDFMDENDKFNLKMQLDDKNKFSHLNQLKNDPDIEAVLNMLENSDDKSESSLFAAGNQIPLNPNLHTKNEFSYFENQTLQKEQKIPVKLEILQKVESLFLEHPDIKLEVTLKALPEFQKLDELSQAKLAQLLQSLQLDASRKKTEASLGSQADLRHLIEGRNSLNLQSKLQLNENKNFSFNDLNNNKEIILPPVQKDLNLDQLSKLKENKIDLNSAARLEGFAELSADPNLKEKNQDNDKKDEKNIFESFESKQILGNNSESVSEVKTNQTQALSLDQHTNKIMQKTIDMVDKLKAQHGSSAKLQIQDNILGQINLQIDMKNKNSIKLSIQTEHEGFKKSIEQKMDILKQSLDVQKIDLTDFKITLIDKPSNASSLFNGQQDKNQQNFNQNSYFQSFQNQNSNGQNNSGVVEEDGIKNYSTKNIKNMQKNSITNIQRSANGSIKVLA